MIFNPNYQIAPSNAIKFTSDKTRLKLVKAENLTKEVKLMEKETQEAANEHWKYVKVLENLNISI